MKLTISSILLLSASVSQAIAVADPHHVTMCGVPGESCWKVRRTTDAIAEHFARPYANKNSYSVCDVQGGACANATEQLLKVGEAAEKLVARHHVTMCGVPGESCWKGKRDPEPHHVTMCGVPGESCWKVRELGHPLQARSLKGKHEGALPESMCGVGNEGCWKIKRENAPAPGRTHLWCGVRGEKCAKRDVDKAVEAANTIQKTHPDASKAACYGEDGECTALLNAHAAFQRIKRESDTVKGLSAADKAAFCALHPCDDDTHLALTRPAAEAKRAEEECNSADGECTVAARGLEELERQLNAAVASLSR